ncbi:MAG: S8 family serine peptidase [Candidatus Competibacteraceae bacterium]
MVLFKSILSNLYWLLLVLICGIPHSAVSQEIDPQEQLLTGQRLLERASQKSRVPIIVRLRMPTYAPEGRLRGTMEVTNQQATISQTQTQTLAQLRPYDVKQVKQFRHVPLLAMHVDAIGLRALLANSNVEAVYEDKVLLPTLADSTPLIGATTAWQQGFTGNGQVVAVLDTGVDKNHPFLSGKVIDEACFSTTNATDNSRTVCPNGQSS